MMWCFLTLSTLFFLLQFQVQIGSKIKELTEAVDLAALTGSGIIDIQDGSYSTAFSIRLFYLFGLVPYKGCRNEVFGTDGKHTDLICGANEISANVCRREREFCDFIEYNAIPLYSMKGTVYLDTEKNSEITLCI